MCRLERIPILEDLAAVALRPPKPRACASASRCNQREHREVARLAMNTQAESFLEKRTQHQLPILRGRLERPAGVEVESLGGDPAVDADDLEILDAIRAGNQVMQGGAGCAHPAAGTHVEARANGRADTSRARP